MTIEAASEAFSSDAVFIMRGAAENLCFGDPQLDLGKSVRAGSVGRYVIFHMVSAPL